jgi:hypothetical protein
MALLRGYLYVITDIGRQYAQVGMTRNVYSRLVSLQTSCPLHLEVVESFPCTYAGVRETLTHQRLKDLRVRGEWFRWDEVRIRTAIADALAFPDDVIKKALVELPKGTGLLAPDVKPRKYNYPVKRLDTGEVFRSAKEAAITVFGSAHVASKIKLAIKKQCFCGPCKWAVAELS